MRDFLPPVFWRTLTGCCMVFGQAIDMDGRRLLPGPTSVISHNSIRIGCLSSKWTENRGNRSLRDLGGFQWSKPF